MNSVLSQDHLGRLQALAAARKQREMAACSRESRNVLSQRRRAELTVRLGPLNLNVKRESETHFQSRHAALTAVARAIDARDAGNGRRAEDVTTACDRAQRKLQRAYLPHPRAASLYLTA